MTANEIHIPRGTHVQRAADTDDVIHSFWVPELNRKIDMIPGQTNRIVLDADRPGRYRGQCAEFCGLQHAHMGFYVFADPPAQFRGWLARAVAAGDPRSGAALFADAVRQLPHDPRYGGERQRRPRPDARRLAARRSRR